jgi:hypothetical protein
VGALRAVARAQPDLGLLPDDAGDLAGRFPGWADLILSQARQIDGLRARLAAPAAETGDSALSQALLELTATVTAIHASASILVGDGPPDPDWQARFLGNIHRDSDRLIQASQALGALLAGDRPPDPRAELDALLDSLGHHFPQIETDPDLDPASVAARFSGLSVPARQMLTGWLTGYVADVRALPMGQLTAALLSGPADPAALAERLGVSVGLALRRLAMLPVTEDSPNVAAVTVDATGRFLTVRRSPGLPLPDPADPCAIWPLWQAMAQRGQLIRARVRLPDGAAFFADCLAENRQAVMVVRADTGTGRMPDTPIGPGCRTCPRASCPARREPAALL